MLNKLLYPLKYFFRHNWIMRVFDNEPFISTGLDALFAFEGNLCLLVMYAMTEIYLVAKDFLYLPKSPIILFVFWLSFKNVRPGAVSLKIKPCWSRNFFVYQNTLNFRWAVPS